MLETIKFIKANGLAEVTNQLAVSVKRHPKFPSLIYLKYDQIDSPMSHPVVQECRGLMLDEDRDWRVVSFPFKKFFNYGEGHAPEIDWATARVYPKLDGSLMTIYFHNGEWQVASNGMPDAGGEVWGHEGTFASLFWETFSALGYTLPMDTNKCYMFELMTPHNQVVVRHARGSIVLLGGRCLSSLKEFGPDADCVPSSWASVRPIPLSSIEDVIASAGALNPLQDEGYVVCDGEFNRIKVKSPRYVALAHMKGSMSQRRMLELVLMGESSELIACLPELADLHNTVSCRVDALVARVEAKYEEIKGIASQKDFAAEATKSELSGALFSLRAGKAASVRSFLAKLPTVAAERALEMDRPVELMVEAQ